VEVLEDEHQRPPVRERFDVSAPGRERLAAAIASELALLPEADECTKVRLDPLFVA
jgi:hypothetical protein